MTHQELKFAVADAGEHPEAKSLILNVLNETNDEIASLYYKEGHWEVAIGAPNSGDAFRISWANFLEISHRFSTFVADESIMMLRECEQTLYRSDE